MEYPVGTHITLENGKEIEIIEGETCKGCFFHKTRINCFIAIRHILGYCGDKYREDHKNVIFKEIRKIDD